MIVLLKILCNRVNLYYVLIIVFCFGRIQLFLIPDMDIC